MGNYTLPKMDVIEVGPAGQVFRVGDIKAHYAGEITCYNYATHRREVVDLSIDGDAVLEQITAEYTSTPSELDDRRDHLAIGPYEACALFQAGHLSMEHLKGSVAQPAVGVVPNTDHPNEPVPDTQVPHMWDIGDAFNLGIPVHIDASFDGIGVRDAACRPLFAGMDAVREAA